MQSPTEASPTAASRPWQPLSARQRRVFGVLVEKAKTTPDAYPMTVNGIVAGSNQKSNREPQMNLSAEDVEQTLAELRGLGCVTEVQGSGRVPKYRHHAYEWLGVEKTELAVVTELLLRGEQTLGELRARAARMEPIADLGALRPVVDALLAHGLMVELTPPGRGQMVTHNLYRDQELSELRSRFAGYVPAESSEQAVPISASGMSRPAPSSGVTKDDLAELTVDLAELRAEVARLKDAVAKLEAKLA